MGEELEESQRFCLDPALEEITKKFCQMVVLTCWWRRGGGLRTRELGGGRRRGWRELQKDFSVIVLNDIRSRFYVLFCTVNHKQPAVRQTI